MKLSIFTPSHHPQWLAEAYASIKDQPFDEWVILLNTRGKRWRSEAVLATDISKDPRVKISYLAEAPPFVGAVKKAACALCTGEILLELDHDDLLMPGAIEAVKKAFESDSAIGFVYSNVVHMNMDGSPRARWAEDQGWRYRAIELGGKTYDETVAFPPHPSSVARIWFAPDHLRAFRRDIYEALGGHSEKMRVLDDLDLMCRFFQVTQFHHIDAPLYIYRVHGDNTWLQHNAEVQNNVHRIYEQYIEQMGRAAAVNEGLLALDLGAQFNPAPGFQTVDVQNATFTADLNQFWPFDSDSVGIVRAYDIFEHLKDPLHTMMELYRVLAPGGLAVIQVPSTDGRGAFQDPTHVSFWNQNSFLYFTHQNWAKYIHTPVRFQSILTYTTAPDGNGVCWVRSHLRKLVSTPQQRVAGPVLI